MPNKLLNFLSGRKAIKFPPSSTYWVTYCNDINGMAFESPLSKGISNWWSDCYGEGPRMFYHAFAAIPEWAPPGENHILYSAGVLKNVSYQPKKILYTATDPQDIEYIKLIFKPTSITVNGVEIPLTETISKPGYTVKKLGGSDFAVTINRVKSGDIIISGL